LIIPPWVMPDHQRIWLAISEVPKVTKDETSSGDLWLRQGGETIAWQGNEAAKEGSTVETRLHCP